MTGTPMTRRRPRSCGAMVLAVALLAIAPRPGAAQSDDWLAIGLTAARSEIRMNGFGLGEELLSGSLYGVEGRASFWRLVAKGEYRQGRLDREDFVGSSQRVLSVKASLGVHILPRVVLAGGPLLSKVGSPDGDRQVLRWRIEAQTSVPLITDLVEGYATLSGSVAGTEVDGFSPVHGGGGDVGVVLSAPGRPVWGKLGFRFDQESLPMGSTQTIETAYLSIGVSVPRGPDAWGGR